MASKPVALKIDRLVSGSGDSIEVTTLVKTPEFGIGATPIKDQVLAFDNATGEWINKTVSGVGDAPEGLIETDLGMRRGEEVDANTGDTHIVYTLGDTPNSVVGYAQTDLGLSVQDDRGTGGDLILKAGDPVTVRMPVRQSVENGKTVFTFEDLTA